MSLPVSPSYSEASLQPRRRTPGPLRLRRLTLGMTQAEVAHLAGLSREQIVRLEAGACEPNLRTMRALAEALEAEPTELFPITSEAPVGAGASRSSPGDDGRHGAG